LGLLSCTAAQDPSVLADWEERFQTVGFEINPFKELDGSNLFSKGLHR
jgi:hypothetical protein